MPLLFVILSAYAIASFVIAQVLVASGSDEMGAVGTIGSLINIFLGLLGIIAIIGIIVGLPLGIYLIATSDKQRTAAVSPTPPTPPTP